MFQIIAPYNSPFRYRPRPNEKAGKGVDNAVKPDARNASEAPGAITPTLPQKIIAFGRRIGEEITQGIENLARYLGMVEFVRAGAAAPAEVALKQEAYFLSLPTGKQWLHVSQRMKQESVGSAQGETLRQEIATQLDEHNRLITIHNQLGHSPPHILADGSGLGIGNATIESYNKAVVWLGACQADLDGLCRQAEKGVADFESKETELEEQCKKCEAKITELGGKLSALGVNRQHLLRALSQEKELLESTASVIAQLVKEENQTQIDLRGRRVELRRFERELSSLRRKETRRVRVFNDSFGKLEERKAQCLADIGRISKLLRSNIRNLLSTTEYLQLDQMLEQAATAMVGSGHAGELNALRNALGDADALRGLRTDWRNWEALGVSPEEFDTLANQDGGNSHPALGNPRHPQYSNCLENWLDEKFSAKEALSFKKAGFKIEEVRHLRGSGITGELAAKMDHLGYTRDFFAASIYGRIYSELNEETKSLLLVAQHGFCLGHHHDAWAEDRPWEIGKGNFNEPVQGHFKDKNGEDADEAISSWVFKKEAWVVAGSSQETARAMGAKLANDESNFGVMAGMVSLETRRAPRLGARNVACWKLAQKLGWKEIVETEFATSVETLSEGERGLTRPTPVSRQVFGIMMKKVGSQVDVAKLTDQEKSQARRSLMRLQLLDHIIGQPDRHNGNIILTRNSDGEIQAVGIDNDQSFPDQVTNPLQLARGFSPQAEDAGRHGVVLPAVIDEDMYKAITELGAVDLWETLQGLLTFKEITAAMERLEHVQEWVEDLKQHGLCIKEDGWGEQEVETKLYDVAELEVDALAVDSAGNYYIDRVTDYADTSYYARLFPDSES